MALDTTNITVQEVFCKNNWELAKSKLTREIFNSFVEKITSDRLKKIFFSSGESILQKLANADISLEKKDVQFLRAVIANRSIDPKYYKFLFLEMADGNKHPYLIRQ